MTTQIFPTTPDCEIVSTRTINFPIALVFAAWAEPNHLKNWWGPKGFTNTFEEFDFREGGRWKFVMHGPDKGNYQNEVEFVKIEKPNLIAWKRYSKPLFKIAASFEEAAKDKTKIVFRMVFDTAEESNKLRPFVVDKNEENFDRLEVELSKMA
jgi:uncharacterized protein YndB with AHSA1/START domain